MVLTRYFEDGRVLAYDFKTGKRLTRLMTLINPGNGAAVIRAAVARDRQPSSVQPLEGFLMSTKRKESIDLFTHDEHAMLSATPGRPVTCIVRHARDSTETLALAHSFSAPQLKWFRVGSALNLFHAA
jgi:hypothetical protein